MHHNGIGSTADPEKCGKTPVKGVKSPGNADEFREIPSLLCWYIYKTVPIFQDIQASMD